MPAIKHELSSEEANAQFRNTTHVEGLEDFLKSVGHPEVEQHRLTKQKLGSQALRTTTLEEFTD
jgi:hypothetical protein